MTNADYYVNVYKRGGDTLTGQHFLDRNKADSHKSRSYRRIGVWHVRLKDRN